MTVKSPCVRNCCLDGNDICMGCCRSLSEILAWGNASDEQRAAILSSAKKRGQEKAPNRPFSDTPGRATSE